MKFKLVIIVTSLWVLLSMCKHDPVIPEAQAPVIDKPDSIDIPNLTVCDPDSIYFENDIKLIFVNNCANTGCHDAITAKKGLILDSYENIISGDNIVSGNPSESDLYEAITETDPDKLMPYTGPNGPGVSLGNEVILKIQKWIQQGAKNNACTDSSTNSTISYSNDIVPILQSNCFSCHSGTTPGQPDLRTYTQLKDRIVAFEKVVVIDKTMPQGGQLSQSDINKIKSWINDGAKNN
jgi:hypothetical protein